MLKFRWRVVESIQVITQTIQSLMTSRNPVHINNGDQFEDKVISQIYRLEVIRAQ